jgi:hypothetical protein
VAIAYSKAPIATNADRLPPIKPLRRADGATAAIVDTGCWLRQLQPVKARFHTPQIFVPVYVQTHARARCNDDGVTVELWRQPKPAPMSLPWIERVAIVGRSPKLPDVAAAPRVIDDR